MLSSRNFPLLLAGAGLVGVSSLYISKYFAQRNKKPVEKVAEPPTSPKQNETELTVLTINDVYELERVEGIGGFSELSHLLNQERKKAKNTITTVNGDFLVVTSISNLLKGAHMVDILNSLKVDYVVVGNHEFDYGPAELKKRISESRFKWFGTNVYESDGSTHFKGLERTFIQEVDGFKIGYFGICTSETLYLSYPEDTVFAPVIETASAAVQELKAQGADVIIAITHQHVEQDRVLAKKVPGIHLIIGGHDHSPYSQFEEETFIHKSGLNANYLGKIHLSIKRTKTGKIKAVPSYSMVTNTHPEQDPEVEKKIRYYMNELESLKDIHYCTTSTALETRTEACRSRETSMGDLIADTVREHFDADAVVLQGGCIRGNSFYEPGTVLTAYDASREFPFPNIAVLSEITGKDLQKGLEEGLRHLPAKAGCFPQISGLEVVVDAHKPPFQRVQSVRFRSRGNEALQPDQTYKVVTTEFIRKGGDGYTAFANGNLIKDPRNGILLHTLFVETLKKNKTISPQTDARTTFL